MWPHMSPRVLWLNGFNFLIASHLFVKYSCHRPGGSSDTAAKIVYMILQEHMIKGTGDFMEESSLLYTPSLPRLIPIDVDLMDI